MSSRNWISDFFKRNNWSSEKQDAQKLRRRKRQLLKIETLESRVVPAGGLTAEFNSGAFRLGNTSENISLIPLTPNDQETLNTFLITSPDGSAASVNVHGTFNIAGTKISGALNLREVNGQGVEMVVAEGAVQLGQTVGISLKDAFGAFVVRNTGSAGVITSEDASDGTGVDIVGIKGLKLDSLDKGVTLAINTSGEAVSRDISTALGSISISFSDGKDVKQISGPADIQVSGPQGTVFRIGSQLTATETLEGLNLRTDQVTVDLYAGTKRAVSLGAASANFSLTSTGLALVDSSFTVSSFSPMPTGSPVTAGQGNYPETALAISADLGPLNLKDVGPALTDLTFGPSQFNVGLGLTAASASLNFAAGEASAEGITASFGLAGNVDSQTGTVSGFTSVGAFSLVADTFSFSVPGVLSASAEGIKLGYNPQASGEQDLLKADSVTIDVEALGLTGEFSSSDTLPALLVRTDGFAFGQGTLTVNKEIKIGSVLTITNPYVNIGNFSYNTTDGLSVGSFGIGAEGLTVTKGDKFTATGSDVEANISFDDAGAVESFTFSAGVLTADIAGLVSLSATEVTFTPTATGSDPMLELGSATATVNVGKSLSLTGSAGAMTIGADGGITGPETLTISLNLTPDEDGSYDSTADKLKLPSFLPIQLKELSLEWPEFSEDSSHFIIDVSATINGSIGPLTVTGGVESLKIDPYLLADDKFPIIALDGFSVSASGNLFGGEISAGLVAGIIKLDEEGNVLDDGATDYDSTVLYGGIEGGFKFAGIGGIELRLGFSELGLHQAYLSANLPGGIVLDATSGLSLNNFHGGVTFNATPLPVVDDPDELLAPIFKPTLSLTADQWREQLKEQVANQASGGSRIFTIEIGEDNSSILTDLTSSTVVSGSDLADAFKNNNYSMAEGGTVTELEAGVLWLVENQGAIYLIEKVDANKLDVTEVQFTMDSSLSSELGNGAVSQSIVDAFVAENINLTNSATVEDLSPDGSPLTKWKITEGKYKYFVTVRGTRLVVTGGTGSFDDMNSVLRIEAGATLYSKYVSENAFKADVDVIITTNGKFLIVGQATMADSVTADVRLFGDLSSLSEESPDDPLKLVFLANMPSQASQTSSIPELLEIKGELTFEFLDQNGKLVNPLYNDPSAFRFNLLGRAEAKATEKFKLVFGGSGGTDGGYAKLSLTVEDKENVDRVQLDVSGSLSIEGVVEATDLVSAAGSLIFQKVTDESNKETLEVFGAVKLDFDTNASGGISLFTKAGLEADAELLFAFNSTTESKTLVLELPGRVAESVVLDPTTISLEGEGTLTFANSIPGVEIGANVSFDGAFSARISIDSVENTLNPDPTVRGDGGLDLDLFVAGQLTAGVNVGNYDFNLLKLNALGLIAIRDIGAEFEGEFLLPQIAGRVDLSIESGMEGIFEVEGSVQMLVNTLGKEFTYVIPDRLQDRLKIIQARSEDKGADQISFPVLPAVDGKLKVIVPDSPPALLDNEEFTAGPYFVLQFGDIDGEEATAGSNEPDGLTDVKMTLMDTFELSGDMRLIVSSDAFKLTARANASISVPGAGDIVQGEATGTLSITEDGFYGNLGIGITLTIPDVSMNALAYIGINTTDKPQTLNFENENFADPVIPSESAQIYLQGELNVGGLALNGSFGLFVSAESIELEVDASLKFFDVDALSVQGTAAIYYGLSDQSQNGFVLSAGLSLGDDGSFGEPGIFEIGGTLNLDIDTRPASSKVQIQISDAYVSILDALEVEGSALISYVGGTEQYFRVEGSFSGNLFDVITIDMSGYFDSRGYFGLTLEGSLKLGTDDFGVQASAKLYLENNAKGLDFGGSAKGKIRAFGVTLLGAAIGVEYDGYGTGDTGTGEITAEAAVTVLGITNSVEFTVGYLLLEPNDTPELGRMDGNVLRLNVGDNASDRNVSEKSKDEAYTITSLGDSTGGGKKIRVRAFGSTQIFDNVTSISGDFGDGDDQVSLVESDDTTLKGLTFNLLGGAGKDMMVNESSASGTFDGGLDDDILLSQNTPDILLGQGGKDLLAGGLNATLKGGDDNDELRWRTDRALPALIEGGAGTDTFVVDGQNIDEVFNIGVTGNDTITVFGASASQFENLIINGRGGADQVSVPVHSLSGVKLKVVELNLSQFEGAGATVNDDGSTDTVTISGDIFTDKFEIKAENGDALVKSSTLFGDMTVTVKAPGQANDKLIVNGGAGADTIKLAGPKSSAASQLLSITLAGESGDDKISLPIGTATIDGGTESDTVIFTVEEGDSANVTLTDTLVSSANGSSASPHFESIQINTSIASDVTVESTFNSTAKLNLSNSADNVTVKSTAGRLLIDGNEQSVKNDVLTLDYSNTDVALVGSMTSTTIRGFANISYNGFESLNFNLGDGSDQFTLFGTEFGTETNIFTGGGADEVYAHSASSRTVVNNVSDSANTADTLFVELTDPNTLTASPFGSYLTFTVGQVVVRDISITPASVPWAYVDGKVYVGTTEIFDTFGIPTRFEGAGAVADSLKVEDKVEQPQYINVAGPQVQIQEGANVASYNSSTNFESFSYPTTVDGLQGYDMAFSPDGLYVYVAGFTDNSVSVFRRESSGALTFLQQVKSDTLGITSFGSVDSLAISPDGRHVYAVGSNAGKVVIFERIASTGRLVYRGYQSIKAYRLAISQHDGGASLYAVMNQQVSHYKRDALTGYLTISNTISTTGFNLSLAVNPKGGILYLTQSIGFAQVSLNSNGDLGAVDHKATVRTNAVVVSPDGEQVFFGTTDNVEVWNRTLNTRLQILDLTGSPSVAALAMDPQGDRLLVSYNKESVDAQKVIDVSIKFVSFKLTTVSDGNDIDELYFLVDGKRVPYTTASEMDESDYILIRNGETVDLDVLQEVNVWQKGEASLDFNVKVYDYDPNVLEIDERHYEITHKINLSDFTPSNASKLFVKQDPDGDVLTFRLTAKFESKPNVPNTLLSYSKQLNSTLWDGGSAISDIDSRISYFDDLAIPVAVPGISEHCVYGLSKINKLILSSNSTGSTTLMNGDSQTVTTTLLTERDDVNTAISADGKFAYSVSPKHGTLLVAAINQTTGAVESASQVLYAGFTPGSSVAISSDGNSVYVTNPAEDSVFAYSRDTTTGNLTLVQVLTDGVNGVDGLAGASSIVIRSDSSQNGVYVIGEDENAIAIFQRNASTSQLTYLSRYTHADLNGPSSMTLLSGGALYVTSANNGKLFSLSVSGGTVTQNAIVTDGLGDVTGMSNPVATAVSPDGKSLYVASENRNSIIVFARSSTGGLTFVESIRNGKYGIQGIASISSIIVSGDGRYVIAASSLDTMAVFGRNATTGQLIFLQRMRDRANGFGGMYGVSDLDILGNRVYVSSAGVPFGSGGLAVLDLSTAPIPTPRVYDVTFAGIENLNVRSANSRDSVTVGDVTVPFTLETQGGADMVTMTNTPSSKATTVNLGNDPDTFVLVSTGANATVKVNGGGGKDDLSVYATGNLASTILNGDADDDTIYVDGIRLGSAVTVTGDTHSAGDTLIFDAHGKIYTKSNVAFIESIRISTATYGVYYDTIENLKIIGSPTAKAGGSYNIAEGGSLTLNAGTSIIPSGQTLVGYEWNVGTGVVTGVNPTLTWNDLKDYGITDNGTYTISVKITTALDGETYSNIDVATLTVTNKAPTLTLAGSSIVEVNSSYTLNLSSTDLGEDTVRTWTINWGDGSPAETYNGTPATATHVYSTESSSRTITATATDEDGSCTPITKSITVAAGRKLSGTATGSEGTPYTLTLGRGVSGLPAIASWTIHWGDGSTELVSGNPNTVNHTYLDDGSYGISAVATDVSNIPRPADNTLTVAIADVAPVVTLSSGTPLAVEGRAIFSSLKVKTSDPGTDTVLNYTVDWGDDTSETVTGDVAELLHTYRDDGKYTVTVSSLTNDDGTFTNPSNSFTFVALSALPVIDTSRLNIPSTGVENVPINLSAVAKSVLTGSEPLTFTWSITPSGGVTYPATVGQTYLVPKDDPLGVEYASKNGITFLPRDNGSYTVFLRVMDDDGDAIFVTRHIFVANQAPTIDTFQVPRSANEGEVVTLQASASDPAGAADPLAYTWTVTERGAEQSVTLNGSTAQWTSNGGEYAVRLEVSDGDGGKAIRSSSLMVTNTAPTITPDSFVVPSEANEGSTSTFSVLAEDDGSAANLTYLWQVIAPDGRVTELEGATVNYQWPDNGDYTVSVKVTDNVGATVIQGPVTVNVLNVKPVLQGFSLYGNREGDAVEIIGYAIDIAGVNDPLEFTWTVTAPNGTKTMLYGETIYYTLPDDGVYYVYVTVSDGDGGIDQANSSPAIYARNVNPTLGEIVLPTEPLFEGPTATLKVPAAVDVAGDLADLTYSWTVVTPSGTTLTSSELEMKVPLLDDGEYSATVVVTDGDGGRAEKSTTFTVGNVDPELVNLTVPSTGYLGFPIDLSALATDVPGDTADLVYNWTLTLPNLQTVTFTGTQVQYTPDVAGSIQVALSITDNDGGTVTSSRTIDVLATPIRFTQFMLPEEINEASFVTVKASAVDELGGAVTYQWTITPPNEAPFQLKGNSASFYAPDNGDFLVSVVAKSSNGEAESSAVVRVVNVDPDLISVNVGPDATTNQPLSLSAVATDVAGSADPLKYDWKITYPDGNVVILTGKNVTFTPTQLGFHGLELKVSDGDGGVAVSRKLIPVLNEPPVASTGGPYSVSEYGTLMLDALTGSSDANQSAESLVYVWDLDNDGIFGESSTIYGDERGSKPTFKAKIDGPATLPVRVRVTDIAGVSTIDDGEVRVKNVVPTASLSGPSSGVRGQTRTINLSATDPSPADIQAGFTYTIHWGDGQSETVPASQNNGSGVQRSHIYSANGDYTVTIRATDKDGGISAPVRMVISIREMAVQDGVLVIGGTTGNDQIDIKPGNGRGNIRVALNNRNYGPYSNVTRIEVYGQAGNDSIQIYGNVAVPAMIDGGDGHDVIATRDGQDIVYGGAGNDVIKTGKGNDFVDGGSGNDFIRGEAGNDILLGGIGNDSIEGGIGRDVIIGGVGADALDGQGDDDLLIAGSTTFDHHYQALGAILSEWTSARRQSQRVANLRGIGSGPRANGSVFLITSGPDATVSDDHDVDQINGASGQDWFLVTGNGVQDRIRDRKKGDTVG